MKRFIKDNLVSIGSLLVAIAALIVAIQANQISMWNAKPQIEIDTIPVTRSETGILQVVIASIQLITLF